MLKLSKFSDQQNDILIAFNMKNNIAKYRRNFHGYIERWLLIFDDRLSAKATNMFSTPT